MTVNLTGTNLDLTPEIRSFLDEKLDDCMRVLGDTDRDPVTLDVELEETTRRHPHELEDQRHYRAEATVSVPGRVIRAEGSEDDLYRSIVQMKHVLMRELRDWREKVTDARREGAREAKHLHDERLAQEPPADEDASLEQKYENEIDEFTQEAESS